MATFCCPSDCCTVLAVCDCNMLLFCHPTGLLSFALNLACKSKQFSCFSIATQMHPLIPPNTTRHLEELHTV